jgi:hypothetical protein
LAKIQEIRQRLRSLLENRRIHKDKNSKEKEEKKSRRSGWHLSP